jgi:hypothetical protein
VRRQSIILILMCIVLLPLTGQAGNWHVAGSLECGDCHLQHATDPEDPSFGGGFSFLLRKNSVNELCLSCHNGTDATAPDVQAPVPMYNSTTSGESAAGFFAMLGVENPNGHTLGVLMPTPLQTTARSGELNCVSCHAPHGNGNYRNLAQDPAVTGAYLIVEVGTNVMTEHAPSTPPNTDGSVIAYSRDNIGYVSGMSAWCTSCHDQLSTNTGASSPAHFNAHPSDLALNAFGVQSHTDPAHWMTGLGEGFGGNAATSARVPFQVPGAADFTASRTPQPTSEVSCASCHKSHGSGNRKSMVWPYLEGGETSLDGCQQCHNK